MTTRVTVSLAPQNGLSEDVVVNTFHLGIPGAGPPLSPSNRAAQIIAFYNGVQATTYSIASFLGFTLSRAANVCKIEMVDLDDASPRVPFYD